MEAVVIWRGIPVAIRQDIGDADLMGNEQPVLHKGFSKFRCHCLRRQILGVGEYNFGPSFVVSTVSVKITEFYVSHGIALSVARTRFHCGIEDILDPGRNGAAPR
jgi:hypothetical protein